MEEPKHGDPRRERLEQLFDGHRRAVLGYALRRVDDPADAADVVGETFLIAWRRLGDVPGDRAARAWLIGVARKVLANHRRGERRRQGLADRLGSELAVRLPSPSAEERSDIVREALDRLPDGDREIVLLAGWEGLAPAEIAVVLGIRPVAARSRLHRARRRLRGELSDMGWEGDAPSVDDVPPRVEGPRQGTGPPPDEPPTGPSMPPPYIDLAKETTR